MTGGSIPEIVISSVQRAPWGWALLGTSVVALIRVWPIINAQLIAVKDRIQDRKERKENDALTDKAADLTDCKTQVAALRKDLTDAVRRIHDLEMRLLGTVSAYRILESDATENNPNGSALHQAQIVFRVAWDHSTPVPADMVNTVLGVQ